MENELMTSFSDLALYIGVTSVEVLLFIFCSYFILRALLRGVDQQDFLVLHRWQKRSFRRMLAYLGLCFFIFFLMLGAQKISDYLQIPVAWTVIAMVLVNRKLIENIVWSLTNFFGEALKPGDFIKTDKYHGVVESMNILSVELKLNTASLVTLPYRDIFGSGYELKKNRHLAFPVLVDVSGDFFLNVTKNILYKIAQASPFRVGDADIAVFEGEGEGGKVCFQVMFSTWDADCIQLAKEHFRKKLTEDSQERNN